MENITGPPVDGTNFFGRKKELERMKNIIKKTKSSMFIPGPRRIGKSSLVKEFIRRNKDKYKFISFDLHSRHSVEELCRDLMVEIKKKFPNLIKSKANLKEKWNVLSEMLPEIVSSKGGIKTGKIRITEKELLTGMEDVFEELNRNHFILAFDEFSDFLWKLKKRNINEVGLFLEWLRRIRQENKIRLIITGSINIISTVEELNFIDLLNDMTDIDIHPLTNLEIKDLLSKLLKSKRITISQAVLDFIIKKLIEGIPFYIQLFVDGVGEYIESDRKINEVSRIERIYLRITSKQHKEFIDMHARLKDYLSGPEYNAVKKILAHIADKKMSFEDLFPYIKPILPKREDTDKLLKRLVDESYLKKENSSYCFISPMLADWWKNSYGWEK